jgi:hypothetical protein
MKPLIYAYEESTRRPAVLFAFAAAAFMVGLGAFKASPWWFLYPMLLLTLSIAWLIIIDRRSGCVLSQTSVKFYAGKWSRDLSSADVRSHEVNEWSDGPPSVQLVLKDGTRYACPQMCLGPAKQFCEALEDIGIKRQK